MSPWSHDPATTQFSFVNHSWAVRNRSSARNRSWLRSSNRSSSGSGTCHGGYRKDRSSSRTLAAAVAAVRFATAALFAATALFAAQQLFSQPQLCSQRAALFAATALLAAAALLAPQEASQQQLLWHENMPRRPSHRPLKQQRRWQQLLQQAILAAAALLATTALLTTTRLFTSTALFAAAATVAAAAQTEEGICDFRPSRAPGRRQASQRQHIGSSGDS